MSATDPDTPGPDLSDASDASDADAPATNGRGTAGPTDSDDTVADWGAVLGGAILGLGVLVVASVVGALLDRNLSNYDDSGWRAALFVVVLVGYLSAGFVAGRRAPQAALTNGALAGTCSFVLWVPVRIVIWAVRDEHKGLFTGAAPVFRVGQLFGHVLIASALGMLGGVVGSRLIVKRVR